MSDLDWYAGFNNVGRSADYCRTTRDFVDVGKQLAGHGTLSRLKRKRVVIDRC